ncbi:MAG: MafI family immunity protein [Bdellovibrionota bacterium]
MVNTHIEIMNLIDIARNIGLSEEDANNAVEYLKHSEYGLALDLLLTQIYEYELPIDAFFYASVEMVAKAMNLPEKDYVYVKELID